MVLIFVWQQSQTVSTFFIMSRFYAQLYYVNNVNDWSGALDTYLKIKAFG